MLEDHSKTVNVLVIQGGQANVVLKKMIVEDVLEIVVDMEFVEEKEKDGVAVRLVGMDHVATNQKDLTVLVKIQKIPKYAVDTDVVLDRIIVFADQVTGEKIVVIHLNIHFVVTTITHTKIISVVDTEVVLDQICVFVNKAGVVGNVVITNRGVIIHVMIYRLIIKIRQFVQVMDIVLDQMNANVTRVGTERDVTIIRTLLPVSVSQDITQMFVAAMELV